MTTEEAAKQLLPFEAPAQPLPADFAIAEQACLGFVPKFLARYRTLKGETEEARQASQKMWEEKEDLRNKLERYLVRNLLPMVDQCKLALSEAAKEKAPKPAAESSETPAADPLATMKAPEGVLAEPAPPEAPPVAAPTQPAMDESVAGVPFVRSIERQLVALLREMGIERVDLLGTTYETVLVDGEAIPEPFEIVHFTQQDKSKPAIVTEVIQDLWITRQHGAIRVLRKGQVNC